MNSMKRDTEKATVHLFSANKIGLYDDPSFTSKTLPSIDALERTYPGFTAGLQKGDIIENIDQEDYR